MKNNSNDLVKQIVKLEKENAKLKSLIEKKHKAGNSEFWKRVWHSIWRNEELESENGKLEGKLADLQSEYVELENFHNNEVKELKEKLEHRNCVDCSNHGSNIKLIKAKAIIKNILQTLKNDDFDFTFALKSKHPVLQEAEQFLKEE